MKKYGKSVCVLICSLCFVLLAACGGKEDNAKRGLNDADFTKASFSAVDREGRAVTAMHRKKTDHERYVGVFYFLWMGTHPNSAGVYDITELQKTAEGRAAVMDSSLGMNDYLTNGLQSPTFYTHWANQPLYGYYNSADPWVIARHIELLTMADVDFIFFDILRDRLHSAPCLWSGGARAPCLPAHSALYGILLEPQ